MKLLNTTALAVTVLILLATPSASCAATPDPPAAPTAYTNAILADNPIHYYRFEETHTQQPAKDAVGGAPNGDQPGTFTPGVTAGQPSASSLLGNTAQFDGSSQALVDLGTPFHPASGAISIEAWVNLDADAPADFLSIVARWDGSYELDVNNTSGALGDGRLNLVTRNDGTNAFGIAGSNDPMSMGEWHHVVGVFENGMLEVFVDGQSVGTGDTGEVASLQDAGTTLFIGSNRDGSSFNWKGFIDEVAFYDYALTELQVESHFLAVPEPATLSLLGLGGMMFRRQRRF